MRRFESSQKEESRAKSADISNGHSKLMALIPYSFD